MKSLFIVLARGVVGFEHSLSKAQRRFDPLLKSPTLPIGESQSTEDKALTPTGKSGDKSENPNLVSGLFFDSHFDADLKLIIERWAKLSVELRQAIVKMVK